MSLLRSLYLTWNIGKMTKIYRFCTEPAVAITRELVRLIIGGDVIHVGATWPFKWFDAFRLIRPDYYRKSDSWMKIMYQDIRIFTYLREFVITCFDAWELFPGETNFICRIELRLLGCAWHFHISCVSAPEDGVSFRFSWVRYYVELISFAVISYWTKCCWRFAHVRVKQNRVSAMKKLCSFRRKHHPLLSFT
jgi:hypothetical protein